MPSQSPLDPEAFLGELCRRYGLPATFAARHRPLVERARSVTPTVRARLLELVERSFEREAERRRSDVAAALRRADDHAPADHRLLALVAGVLHRWNPPDWVFGTHDR